MWPHYVLPIAVQIDQEEKHGETHPAWMAPLVTDGIAVLHLRVLKVMERIQSTEVHRVVQ